MIYVYWDANDVRRYANVVEYCATIKDLQIDTVSGTSNVKLSFTITMLGGSPCDDRESIIIPRSDADLVMNATKVSRLKLLMVKMNDSRLLLGGIQIGKETILTQITHHA